MARILILLTCFIALGCSKAPTQWELKSPDGKINSLVKQDQSGHLTYSVSITNDAGTTELVSTSPLGIVREDQVFDKLKYLSASHVLTITDEYTLSTGKKLHNKSKYNERTLNFSNENGSRLDIVFRAYNEGIAFKYVFPEPDTTHYTVIKELTGFNIPDGKAWLQPYDTISAYSPAYERNYEGPFTTGIPAPGTEGWCFPALFEINNHWILLSEANLKTNFFGSHLNQFDENKKLYTVSPPLQEEAAGYGSNTASSTLPWDMPWRVIMAANDLAGIVESNLVFHLSDPSVIKDPSWVIPGKASWGWWSGYLPGQTSDTPEKLRRFIDMAQQMQWEYSLIDASWDTRRGLDIKEMAAYARQRNVKLMLWYNAGGPVNTVNAGPRDRMFDRETRRQEMKRISELGISGIKVDFFSSDKQDFIQLFIDILEDAADFNILVNFHGCTIPRGWARTYPHLVTMESVKGAEGYIYHSDFEHKGAVHKAILPYTRNVIGSMDYTPMALSTSYVPHRTSFGFELAITVVFESGVQHFPDMTQVYLGLPEDVKQFLQQLPAAWEDTRYLMGYPAADVVLARRSGDAWFIGGINAEEDPKEFEIDFGFLNPGTTYDAVIITDGETNELFASSKTTLTSESIEKVRVLPVGGFVIQLLPVK